MPICGKQRRLRSRGVGDRKQTNFEFYVPEGGGRRRPPARSDSDAHRRPSSDGAPASRPSVVPGRREQRELAAAAAAASASGSEVHVVGEGGGRHHPHPGAGADHAVVVHPGRADDGRRGDAAQEAAVVETGGSRSTVVVGERARGGGVVEVSDLRRVVLLVVVVRGAAHGGEGRVGVDGRAVAVARREEGDGPRGEEVLGVGVGAGPRGVASPRTSTASASTSASASAAEPLHALEVEAVLLEVGRDVLAREAVDAHQLHYGLGHGVLDAEVRHGVDEALVQLRRPHEARPLERPRRLVAGAAPAGAAAGARGRRRAAAAAVAVDVGHTTARATGAPRTRPAAVRGDVEGDGEIGRDERLRERHELVRPRELVLVAAAAAREPAGLLLLPHVLLCSPSSPRGEQSNSCSSVARLDAGKEEEEEEARLHSSRRSKRGEEGEEGGVTSRWISLLLAFLPFVLSPLSPFSLL